MLNYVARNEAEMKMSRRIFRGVAFTARGYFVWIFMVEWKICIVPRERSDGYHARAAAVCYIFLGNFMVDWLLEIVEEEKG